MSYAKVFDNFVWVDQEDGETTPLSAANLNLINTALDLIDSRVINILNGPFTAYVTSLSALGIVKTDSLSAYTNDGIITVNDDVCFSEDVEIEGDLSLAGSLAFQNVGANTINSPTALTVTTPVSLTLNATSNIELTTGSGKANYNGSEIATKAEVGESGTDLNTLTSEGMYQIQNPNNAPSGVTGWVTLSVIPTSNDATYCRQMLYIPSSDDMYTRNNAGGTWGSWNKVALKSDLAQSYSAVWTATASSSYGTQLSNSITVPSGLYLLSFRTPYSTDTTPIMIGLGGYVGANTTFLGGDAILSMNPTQDEKTMIVRFSAQSTIYISTKASASMSWDSSYLNRGGFTAIRLAD